MEPNKAKIVFALYVETVKNSILAGARELKFDVVELFAVSCWFNRSG